MISNIECLVVVLRAHAEQILAPICTSFVPELKASCVANFFSTLLNRCCSEVVRRVCLADVVSISFVTNLTSLISTILESDDPIFFHIVRESFECVVRKIHTNKVMVLVVFEGVCVVPHV